MAAKEEPSHIKRTVEYSLRSISNKVKYSLFSAPNADIYLYIEPKTPRLSYTKKWDVLITVVAAVKTEYKIELGVNVDIGSHCSYHGNCVSTNNKQTLKEDPSNGIFEYTVECCASRNVVASFEVQFPNPLFKLQERAILLKSESFRRSYEDRMFNDIILQALPDPPFSEMGFEVGESPVGSESEGSETDTETKKVFIQAHKVVLAASSDVFKALLMSDMQERLSNVIQVNFPVSTVKQLLLFFYTGHVSDFNSDLSGHVMAMSLLPLADFYQAEALKSLCELRLIKHLRGSRSYAEQPPETPVKELLEIFVMAGMYRCDSLINEAADHTAKHFKAALDMKGWDDFRKNPQLVTEVMLRMVPKISEEGVMGNPKEVLDLLTEARDKMWLTRMWDYMDKVAGHFKLIVKDESWTEFVNNHQDLQFEILCWMGHRS